MISRGRTTRSGRLVLKSRNVRPGRYTLVLGKGKSAVKVPIKLRV